MTVSSKVSKFSWGYESKTKSGSFYPEAFGSRSAAREYATDVNPEIMSGFKLTKVKIQKYKSK